MAAHNELGKEGEQLAAEYLVSKGFKILHRNWRYSRYEIDIIASKENLLHFIEVKLRSSSQFGHPEDSVSKKKINFLLKAVEEYLFLNPQHTNFHLDILSITPGKNQPPEIVFIEDVYL